MFFTTQQAIHLVITLWDATNFQRKSPVINHGSTKNVELQGKIFIFIWQMKIIINGSFRKIYIISNLKAKTVSGLWMSVSKNTGKASPKKKCAYYKYQRVTVLENFKFIM